MANIEMNVLKVGNSEFEIADAKARQDCSDLKEDFFYESEALGSIQYLAKGTATKNNISLESTGEKVKVNGTDGGNFIVLLTDTIKTITYSTINDQTKPIHLQAGHTYIINIIATPNAYSSNNNVRFMLLNGNISAANNAFFWSPCRTGKYVLNVYNDTDVCAALFVQYNTTVTNLEVYAHIVDTKTAEIESNSEKLKDLRTLYYTASIQITAQQANTHVPFMVYSGETLKFTNNTTGNVALHVLDANGTTTTITTGLSAGASISFTATSEYVQLLYWSQQLGTVAVEKTSSLYNALVNKVDELESENAKIELNSEKLENLRTLYFTASIPITVQGSNTYIPFTVHSGEALKFTNNTTGNIALHLIDSEGTTTTITTGISAGASISFTSNAEYVQLLYWSQQLGTVAVDKTSSLYNMLATRVDELQSDGITASVNMFESIAAIGDSYTAGSSRTSGGTWVDKRNLSWIATMGKRSGTEWKNYGHGGATTKSYLETTEFASALSDNPCDIYFFALGQNDGNQSLTIGTVADIHDADYTQNPETFYGCYGKIIQQIKDHAPNAKLIMVTGWVQGATWTAYDEAIRGIATHYNIPVIEPFDDYFFNSELYQNYKEYGHPTPLGYSSMGIAMERLFSKCVVNNPSYFKFATIG